MQAISELLTHQNGYTSALIRRVAEKYGVCPYELSLDLSEFCSIVICDYNYVYNPAVKLRRYFVENNGKYVLLVDEAHNLIDRARDMFSCELHSSSFVSLMQQIPEVEPLYNKLKQATSAFKIAKRYCRDALQKDARVTYCVCDRGVREEGEWAWHVSSVILFGEITVIDDQKLVKEITAKLSRKFTQDEAYIRQEIESYAAGTLLLRLDPVHMCGKLVKEA
jgi:Rad3-related DNA helicase